MTDCVFISYSRRDQEFVIKLAEDLNRHVGCGVWFDQSDIQAGDDWLNRIKTGIRDCTVFIYVISPDSVASQYASMELAEAQAHNKRIIPVIYRTTKFPPDLATLVKKIQYIDLRKGSYEDNFQYLQKALITAGVMEPAPGGIPFLVKKVRTHWGPVFLNMLRCALVWAIAWAAFWLIIRVIWVIFFKQAPPDAGSTIIVTPEEIMDSILNDPKLAGYSTAILPAGGFVGGLVGGLLAGLIMLLSLRRYAPSISWQHLSAAIPIWLVAGPLGLLLSIFIIPDATYSLAPANCQGLPLDQCFQQVSGNLVQGCVATLMMAIVVALVMVLFMSLGWFITGLVAGWWVVRHIRRLEPGIGKGQSFWVMVGWGLGGVAGTIGTLVAISRITEAVVK